VQTAVHQLHTKSANVINTSTLRYA